ncbi:MAG TPA: ROK family protein [Solirubrobacteraceae bacterium]|nr:ROK family protein [Solirubrobacteraceae bacterium]
MTAECVIGVDLGGTKAIAGAVDPDLGVHYRARREVPTSGLHALLDTLTALVEEVRRGAGGEVAGVGFGIPCLIDQERGIAASSVHLPIEGLAFADVMAERLALPVFADNDGNLALLAEHRAGAAADARNAVMLTLGTGIAGGVVIGGELYRGSQGAAGELGHMVVRADGPDCGPGCPSRGCLESLVSGTALRRDARLLAAREPDGALGRAQAAGREISGPLVTELAHDGDPQALALLHGLGEWLGVGLVNVVNIFNPEVVVIGGGVIAAGELILEPARRVLAGRALALPAACARVEAARFGADSGMLGAALYARERLLERVSI